MSSPQQLPSEQSNVATTVSARVPTARHEQTSAAKLEEGILEIVRAELLRAGIDVKVKVAHSPKLLKSDIAFLVLAIIDLVMLFWLIPSDFWKDERIAFIKDLFPILIGSLCGFLATLYRDPILKVAQNTAFRLFDIVLAVVLVIVWAPLFSFRPLVEPPDVQVKVDAENEPRDLTKPLRVNLRQHTYKVMKVENGTLNTRSFTMAKWDLILAAWGHSAPRWSLEYHIPIHSNTQGLTIIIERKESPFDRDFLRPDFLVPNQLTKLDEYRIRFQMEAEEKGGWLVVPAGHYILNSATPNCVATPQPLEIPPKLMNAVQVLCK